MGNLYPSLLQIKDGKMARFGFCAALSLIWGMGFGLLFHFILSKIVARRPETSRCLCQEYEKIA